MTTPQPTPSQVEMLQQLEKSQRPLPKSELDGRVVRALLARGWAAERKNALHLTDAGKAALQDAAQPVRGRRRSRTPTNGRAEAILRAVESLGGAIPPDSELAVGPMYAHVDDVLSGFRKLALKMQRGP
jgi:hypothetical protein